MGIGYLSRNKQTCEGVNLEIVILPFCLLLPLVYFTINIAKNYEFNKFIVMTVANRNLANVTHCLHASRFCAFLIYNAGW